MRRGARAIAEHGPQWRVACACGFEREAESPGRPPRSRASTLSCCSIHPARITRSSSRSRRSNRPSRCRTDGISPPPRGPGRAAHPGQALGRGSPERGAGQDVGGVRLRALLRRLRDAHRGEGSRARGGARRRTPPALPRLVCDLVAGAPDGSSDLAEEGAAGHPRFRRRRRRTWPSALRTMASSLSRRMICPSEGRGRSSTRRPACRARVGTAAV